MAPNNVDWKRLLFLLQSGAATKIQVNQQSPEKLPGWLNNIVIFFSTGEQLDIFLNTDGYNERYRIEATLTRLTDDPNILIVE